MDQAKNFAKATVADNNYDASATEIVLLTGGGVRLPSTPFNATWWNASDFPDPSDDPAREIVRVTDITGDTLTIVRGQENTAAEDHNLAGKTYHLMAGLTARTINMDLVGDVFGSGLAVLVQTDDNRIRLRGNATHFLDVGTGSIGMQSESIAMGDVEGEGNFTQITINDVAQLVAFLGKLGTDQSSSASTPGTVTKKLPIYDQSGTLLGYIPIYDSIT